MTAESAPNHHAALACAPPRSAAEAARTGHTTVSLDSLSGRQRSLRRGYKPLRISRAMSACYRMSIGGNSELREAQMARASTVRGARVLGDDWLGTHVQNMNCMATISLNGPRRRIVSDHAVRMAVGGESGDRLCCIIDAANSKSRSSCSCRRSPYAAQVPTAAAVLSLVERWTPIKPSCLASAAFCRQFCTSIGAVSGVLRPSAHASRPTG